jgi:predicted RNA-binding protein with RPS1 domain
VRGWVQKPLNDDGEPVFVKKGGKINVKILDIHKQAIANWVEENPKITFKEIRNNLAINYEVAVSLSTIGNCMDGMALSIKNLHYEPQNMNSEENKVKRRDYLQRLMQFQGEHKRIFFIDETNFNCWISRRQGWSKKGSRSTVRRTSSKGANLHLVGAIESLTGLTYWESRRGSLKAVDFNNWVIRCLRSLIDIPMGQVVLVIDNAPCHSRIDLIKNEEEFAAIEILRLGPYSPALNAIEAVWSSVKSKIKQDMALLLPEIINNPRGVTQLEHRLLILERVAREAMRLVTWQKVVACIQHTQQHYETVLELRDLPVGN